MIVEDVAREHDFSGVVRVDRRGAVLLERAYGLANRSAGVPNRPDTILATASGTKGLTALAVTALIEQGTLSFSTPVRELLGSDLPLIDDRVTVDHLLAHRSGIGDYVDEDLDLPITEYTLNVPLQRLETTEDYLGALEGFPSKFSPGERFSYCNSGYVVLALVAERGAGTPFAELVRTLVCEPAGMADTAFRRSDELPPRAAIGYLSNSPAARTNIFHLPVIGSGDGGIYTTAADVRALWTALFADRIVTAASRARLTSAEHEGDEYGRGFWLHERGVMLEGMDAGVSFRSVHDPTNDVTATVISNDSDGAWPMARHLEDEINAGSLG